MPGLPGPTSSSKRDLLPHLGYVEERIYESIYGMAIDQIVAFAAGKPINVANPEALGAKA